MDSCISHSLVSYPIPVVGVLVCPPKCQTSSVRVCVRVSPVSISLSLKVWLGTSVSVFVSVCGKGVINHDLNVDVAGYETSRSRCHLRQLLPYTSQPLSHFTCALINRGKCKWINIVWRLMPQITVNTSLIWNVCVAPGTWLEKMLIDRKSRQCYQGLKADTVLKYDHTSHRVGSRYFYNWAHTMYKCQAVVTF